MKYLRQLKPQDVMFIGGETPSVYQHTAGLVLLESSERPGFGFEQYRQHIAERVDAQLVVSRNGGQRRQPRHVYRRGDVQRLPAHRWLAAA